MNWDGLDTILVFLFYAILHYTMNIFDVLQYMIDNEVNGIDLSNNKETVTIHQFLNNGKVLQTTTTQTVLNPKKAKT